MRLNKVFGNINLKYKIPVLTIMIFLVIMSVNTIINIIIFKNNYTNMVMTSTRGLGNSLSSIVNELLSLDLPLNQMSGLDKKCTDMLNNNNEIISYCFIADLNGKILYHSNPDEMDKILNDNAMKASIKSSVIFDQIYQKDKIKYYDLTVPVVNNKEHIGMIRLGSPIAIIDKKINDIVITSIIIFLISFLLCGVVFYFLINVLLIRPINETKNMLKDISRGEGDLTQRLKVVSSDELGELARFFNNFISYIANMIKQIKTTIDRITIFSNNLANISAISTKSIDQIRINMETIKNKTVSLDHEIVSSSHSTNDVENFISKVINLISSQVRATDQSISSVDQMVLSIKDMVNNFEEKLLIANDLEHTAISGKKEMENTIDMIKKVTASANIIMDMISVINDIAAKTNLLSMNANIEASHAGEFGKGFSVVANEIRKLSESTTKNSKEISKSLKQVIDYINESGKTTTNTSTYFNTIVDMIKNVAQSMTEMKKSMHDLSVTNEQITDNYLALSGTSNEVKTSSNEMYEKIKIITQAMIVLNNISSDTKNGMIKAETLINDVYKSMEDLAKVGIENVNSMKELENLVSKFKVD